MLWSVTTDTPECKYCELFFFFTFDMTTYPYAFVLWNFPFLTALCKKCLWNVWTAVKSTWLTFVLSYQEQDGQNELLRLLYLKFGYSEVQVKISAVTRQNQDVGSYFIFCTIYIPVMNSPIKVLSFQFNKSDIHTQYILVIVPVTLLLSDI